MFGCVGYCNHLLLSLSLSLCLSVSLVILMLLYEIGETCYLYISLSVVFHKLGNANRIQS